MGWSCGLVMNEYESLPTGVRPMSGCGALRRQRPRPATVGRRLDAQPRLPAWCTGTVVLLVLAFAADDRLDRRPMASAEPRDPSDPGSDPLADPDRNDAVAGVWITPGFRDETVRVPG